MNETEIIYKEQMVLGTDKSQEVYKEKDNAETRTTIPVKHLINA